MKLNRLTVLITILIVASVGTNIFTMWHNDFKLMPSELTYQYPGMFKHSAIMYRPAGTEGLALIDMDTAVIRVTEFGAPLNCAVISIYTTSGIIDGACVEGVLDE